MKQEIINKSAKELDYSVIKQIREHAKKYDLSSDKKNFLKYVSAYEQKVILLQSKNPYEVITYLQELDLKSSRLVLDELSFDEISKILELFTSEHKESFYNNFPELSLVNEFIVCDKNSSEYIKELPLDRKVELIDSSNTSTILATSKVYDSMTLEEKTIAVKSMESVNAIDALNKISEYKEDQTLKEQKPLEKQEDHKINDEKLKIELKRELETEEEKEMRRKINDFLKMNIQLYIQKNKLFETFPIDAEDLYSLLPPELKELIDKDFAVEQEKQKEDESLDKQEVKEEKPENETLQNDNKDINSLDQNDDLMSADMDIEKIEKYSIIGNGEYKVNIVKQPEINVDFTKAKDACERELIYKVKQDVKLQPLENAQPIKTR